MKRTATIEHNFEIDFDYEKFGEHLLITYAQYGQIVLVFSEDNIGEKIKINDKVISVSLSQEDTKMFKQGHVNIELKICTKDRKVLINEVPIQTYVSDVINEELFV